VEHLRIKPVQLVPQPIGTATELFKQRFLRSTQLPQQQELRFIQVEPTKTGLIGTDGVGQDKGIAPVILGARHSVAVTKASELFGVNRKDVEASLNQSFDNRTPWHFDGHGYPLWLSRRQSPQPGGELSQAAPIMVYHSFPHHMTVAVEHADLMLL
jgi:hypothetical protein